MAVVTKSGDLGLKRDSVILIVGSPGSGKSNMVRHLIFGMRKQFNYGIVISSTLFDGEYDFVPAPYRHTLYSDDIISHMSDVQRSAPNTHAFLIIDDGIGMVNYQSAVLQQFMTTLRHLRITCFLTTQYVSKMPAMFRENANFAFLFKQNTRLAIKAVYESFGQYGFDKEKDFKEWFQEQTSVPYRCVLYYKDKLSASDKYSLVTAPDMSHRQFTLTFG